MERYKHVNSVCGGLNQYTPVEVGKTLFWGPGCGGGGGGQQVFSSLQERNKKFLTQLKGDRCFFQHMFPISGAPQVVINDTSLSTNDYKTKYGNSIHQ